VVGTIGRLAIVPQGFEGNIARAIARLACGPSVLPNWIRYWLQNNVVQWWLLRSSREVARKTLNLSDLAKTRVAVPSRKEQEEIVRRTEDLFAFVAQLEQRVAAARRLLEVATPSTLAKAFRGELVPQDPNDEPASVLLARIRADREAAPKTAKPKAAVARFPRRQPAINGRPGKRNGTGRPVRANADVTPHARTARSPKHSE
jgi:type I restriction enzyme S subunit